MLLSSPPPPLIYSLLSGLYDKAHGLMAPKDESGRTSSNFHEIEWGNGFVEGNAWHHRYALLCRARDVFLSD